MVADSELQRIARLTPLADVLASFDIGVGPVEPREEAVAAAVGKTLAADVAAAASHPEFALALRDGFAVRAELTADASSYSPAPLSPAPPRIEVGGRLPAGMDAVAAFDSISMQAGRAQALASVAPGEGVLPAGADAAPSVVMKMTGARLRRIDAAALLALGIERVPIREPRVRVVRVGAGAVIGAAAALIASAIEAEGGVAIAMQSQVGQSHLEAALHHEGADAVVAIGGTGSGRNDESVRTLGRAGKVAFHGIGIAPGETTAFGYVGARPALLLPGRLDAALAGWLTVGRRMLARLAFRLSEEQPFNAELSRKVASPLGLAEVVPVRRRGFRIEPLASHYLPMQTLTRSDGWILVPADSEGYQVGTSVPVRPWP
jgi:molybdopterin biosynthesis enzyme